MLPDAGEKVGKIKRDRVYFDVEKFRDDDFKMYGDAKRSTMQRDPQIGGSCPRSGGIVCFRLCPTDKRRVARHTSELPYAQVPPQMHREVRIRGFVDLEVRCLTLQDPALF